MSLQNAIHPYLPSLRLLKSTSNKIIQNYTSQHRPFQPSAYSHNTQCIACIHQRQLSPKTTQSKVLSPINSQTSHQSTQELLHLKKSKQFLQVLLQKNQQEYKASLDKASARITQYAQQIDNKNKIIQHLQSKLAMNLLAQQYGNTSFVGALIQNNRQLQLPKHSQLPHTVSLEVEIKRLTFQLQQIKIQYEQSKKKTHHLEDLQLRLKQLQIYAKQYDSMKLLIHKMQTEKQQVSRRHINAIKDITKKHKEELQQLQRKLDQATRPFPSSHTLIDIKSRQISNTHQSTKAQFSHLQELIQQKDTMVDHLESKINYLQSELTFLKNRYGYLLKLVWNSPQQNEIGSNSELQDYCIQRVGRHNLSNGKQSLIGLNLSPIKRR